MPNIQIPLAPQNKIETRSKPKKGTVDEMSYSGAVPKEAAEPFAPAMSSGTAVKRDGGIPAGEGGETKSGVKRVNSLELFNFSFDGPAMEGASVAPLSSQEQQDQDTFDLLTRLDR